MLLRRTDGLAADVQVVHLRPALEAPVVKFTASFTAVDICETLKARETASTP